MPSTTRSHRKSKNASSPLIRKPNDSPAPSNEPRKEKGQLSLDSWIEPPLKPPAPSFEDDGLERQGVLKHMAPLGQMPSAKFKARLKSNIEQRPSVWSNGFMSESGEAQDTPGTTPPVEQEDSDSRQHEEEDDEDPFLALPTGDDMSDLSDDDYVPRGVRVSSRSGKAATRNSTSSTPGRVTRTPTKPAAKKMDRDKLERAVEAAVSEANAAGKRHVGLALQRLHEETRTNHDLVEILTAILHRTATDKQTAEFQRYMKEYKKPFKTSRKARQLLKFRRVRAASPTSVQATSPAKPRLTFTGPTLFNSMNGDSNSDNSHNGHNGLNKDDNSTPSKFKAFGSSASPSSSSTLSRPLLDSHHTLSLRLSPNHHFFPHQSPVSSHSSSDNMVSTRKHQYAETTPPRARKSGRRRFAHASGDGIAETSVERTSRTASEGSTQAGHHLPGQNLPQDHSLAPAQGSAKASAQVEATTEARLQGQVQDAARAEATAQAPLQDRGQAAARDPATEAAGAAPPASVSHPSPDTRTEKSCHKRPLIEETSISRQASPSQPVDLAHLDTAAQLEPPTKVEATASIESPSSAGSFDMAAAKRAIRDSVRVGSSADPAEADSSGDDLSSVNEAIIEEGYPGQPSDNQTGDSSATGSSVPSEERTSLGIEDIEPEPEPFMAPLQHWKIASKGKGKQANSKKRKKPDGPTYAPPPLDHDEMASKKLKLSSLRKLPRNEDFTVSNIRESQDFPIVEKYRSGPFSRSSPASSAAVTNGEQAPASFRATPERSAIRSRAVSNAPSRPPTRPATPLESDRPLKRLRSTAVTTAAMAGPPNVGPSSRIFRPGASKARTKMSPVKPRGPVTASVGRSGGGIGSSSGPLANDDNGVISDSDDYCANCNLGGFLICCDTCTKAFHFHCCDPPKDLTEQVNAFQCWECRKLRKTYDSEGENDGSGSDNPTLEGGQPRTHLFSDMCLQMHYTDTREFYLPQDVRERYKGVSIDETGSYKEASKWRKITKSDFNYAVHEERVKDKSGNLLFCHHCGGSGVDMLLCKCDIEGCGKYWHRECTNPPSANGPPISFDKSNNKLGCAWTCPLHVQHAMNLQCQVPGGRRHRYRELANPVIITPAIPRAIQDTRIEITDDEDDEEFETEIRNGVVYRLPARGVILNFIQRAKENRNQLLYEHLIKQRQQSMQQPAPCVWKKRPTLQSQFYDRPLTEQQAALDLAFFAHREKDINLLSDGVQTLLMAVLREAPHGLTAWSPNDTVMNGASEELTTQSTNGTPMGDDTNDKGKSRAQSIYSRPQPQRSRKQHKIQQLRRLQELINMQLAALQTEPSTSD